MNHYAPPNVEVADTEVAGIGSPWLFKTSGIVLAALIGGAPAAGYLTYRNLINLGRPQSAKHAALVFGLISAAFLVAAWHAPIDVISQLISFVIPQLALVLLAKSWLVEKPLQGSPPVLFRSNWLAVGIGVLGNVAIKTLFLLMGLAIAATSA